MLAHECLRNSTLQKQVVEEQEVNSSLKLMTSDLARCAMAVENRVMHSDTLEQQREKMCTAERIAELEHALEAANGLVLRLQEDQV
jgi:hypothetical protein